MGGGPKKKRKVLCGGGGRPIRRRVAPVPTKSARGGTKRETLTEGKRQDPKEEQKRFYNEHHFLPALFFVGMSDGLGKKCQEGEGKKCVEKPHYPEGGRMKKRGLEFHRAYTF